MTRARPHLNRDERGASLILAIAFMVVIGAVTGALLSSISSGLNDRVALDKARNREYAADGLVDYAIAQARSPVISWNPSSVSTFVASATSTGCGGPYAWSLGNVPSQAHLNNVNIRVECTPAPAQTRAGYLQRNAIFVACPDPGSAGKCTDPTTIVRAQINFSDSGQTTVQAWSVNG
jgi:hypothetical protein